MPKAGELPLQGGQPLNGTEFIDKTKLLEDINAYARAKDNRVRQVSIGLSGEWQVVCIIRPGMPPFVVSDLWCGSMYPSAAGEGEQRGPGIADVAVAPVMPNGSIRKTGRDRLTKPCARLWSTSVIPAPAGEMDVVLGGWPGILLHGAVGHAN